MFTATMMTSDITVPYREIKLNSYLLVPLGGKSASSSQTKSFSSTPNTRTTHSKVRTGCRTCKARHVKCDERKPDCSKCTSTGRKCDGYEVEMAIIPSKGAGSRPISQFMHYIPMMDIPGDSRDRRMFHYFRSRSITAMSGYFGNDFWDRLVLQMCHNYPTVRHALLALGSLYEEYDDCRRSQQSPNGKSVESHSSVALQQYNKAVRLLATDLSAPDPALEGILTSCLIFVCLEFLRNNVEIGLNHLKAGMHILVQVSSDSTPAKSKISNSKTGSCGSKSGIHAIDSSVISLFRSLYSQAIARNSNFDKTSPSVNSIPCLSFSDVTPSTFKTLLSACEAFQEICGSLFQLIRQYETNPGLALNSQDPDPLSHAARSAVIENYLGRFSRWLLAFELLVSQLPVPDKSQKTAIALQRLHHRTIYVSLRSLPQRSEMVYDTFNAAYEETVELAAVVVEGMDAESGDLPVLSADFGIIAPLYVLAWKCRDSKLRARALELMKRAPTRESIWGRDSAVLFAEWKIRTEEQAALTMGWSYGEVMPLEARTYDEHLTEIEGLDGQTVTVVSFKRRWGEEIQDLKDVVDSNIELGDMI